MPPGTGLFLCFDSFNSPVPMQTCTHTHQYIHRYINMVAPQISKLESRKLKIQDSEGNSLNPKPWVLMREVWKEDLDSKSFSGNLES